MADPRRLVELSTPDPDAERLRDGETRPSGAARLIPPGLDAVLVLLRHGETEAIIRRQFQGQMETPLSAAGEAQIRRAAHLLAFRDGGPELPVPATAPRFMIHSPLGRARQSAGLVAEAMAEAGVATPPLRSMSGFTEIGQGEWEGLTDAEITARFGDSLRGWRRWPERFHAPGGEELAEVFVRAEAALAEVLAELARDAAPGTLDRHQVLGYGDSAVDRRPWGLVVGHGGIFRVVTCALLDMGPEHFWNFDFGLASIAVIEIRAGRAVLRALNVDAPDLPASQPDRRGEGAL